MITGLHRQDSNQSKIPLLLTKRILNTSVSAISNYKTTHACNTSEVFPSMCWSPSYDGHHWLKHAKALFYY
jgi:hypothetical protein